MTDGSPIRVLIVDDEYPIRVSLGGYLEDRGFEVFSAESAEETLDMLNRQDIDCVIVDLRLPGLDGTELILKAHRRRPSLQFLIHTGSADYRLPPSLLDLAIGQEDVFQKPVANMKVIVDAIQRLVRKEDT